MVDNILDSAKASLDSAKEKIKSVTENLFDDEEKEIIEQFKSSGQDKIKETFSTFISSPVIQTRSHEHWFLATIGIPSERSRSLQDQHVL